MCRDNLFTELLNRGDAVMDATEVEKEIFRLLSEHSRYDSVGHFKHWYESLDNDEKKILEIQILILAERVWRSNLKLSEQEKDRLLDFMSMIPSASWIGKAGEEVFQKICTEVTDVLNKSKNDSPEYFPYTRLHFLRLVGRPRDVDFWKKIMEVPNLVEVGLDGCCYALGPATALEIYDSVARINPDFEKRLPKTRLKEILAFHGLR